jgi:hypothetical protein
METKRKFTGSVIDKIGRQCFYAGELFKAPEKSSSEKTLRNIDSQIKKRLVHAKPKTKVVKVYVPKEQNVSGESIRQQISETFPTAVEIFVSGGADTDPDFYVKVILSADETTDETTSTLTLGCLYRSEGSVGNKEKNIGKQIGKKFTDLALDGIERIELCVPVHDKFTEPALRNVLVRVVPELIPSSTGVSVIPDDQIEPKMYTVVISL